MSLNDKPAAERVHIGFFGLRNAGKSSLVNAVTGQNIALVSEIKGTTTDPVQKTMELLPIGPVVIIDTPGMDDEGELGEMRVERAERMLQKTDLAVLVADAATGLGEHDGKLIRSFTERKIPFVIAFNKCDLLETVPESRSNSIYVSAKTGYGIDELKERLGKLLPAAKPERTLIGDLVSPVDIVVLVTPIDESAPKGRLILPQQQMIRSILDAGAINIVVKDTELESALASLGRKPQLVITDSQAFGKVSKIVPEDILLTSFSILFARYKGELELFAAGAAKLDALCDGSRVLISEGCTHHRQCNDIGTVKMPNWIRNYTKKDIAFDYTSGGDFPSTTNLKKYTLIVHCGACMLNEREVHSRIESAAEAGVDITNYGIAIAQMHGILRRSLSPFPKLLQMLNR